MFLNNIILFSLIAVAVPILLHLLNLQKVREMEFSTLMFLKEIQKSKFRRIRIKHLLLLLIRIAIIVFLIFAFADPFLRGYSGKNSNSQKLGIVFIDSSFSMLYNKDSSNLYKNAVSVAARISDTYSSSDELITIVTKVQSDTSNNYIPVKPNLNSILNKTNDILKNRNQNTSEIFIISDLQKINFHDNLYQPNNYSNFYLIDVAENEQPNISISNLIVESKILGISFPVKFKVIVRNHTGNFLTGQKLTLFINDTYLEDKYFDLKPNEIKPIDFSFKPASVGVLTFKAELTASNKQLDAFNEDNQYFNQIYIPEKINIGIISESLESSKYIRAVFDAANLNSQGEKVYNYTESSKLNNLLQYDVLYLCGLNKLSESDIGNINRFSETGKMIIIFLSEEINIDDYNKIKGIKISTLNKVNTDASISEINTESPLFHDLFKTKKGEIFNSSTLEGINLKSYFTITPSQNSNVLLSLRVPNSNPQIPLIIALSSLSPIVSSLSPIPYTLHPTPYLLIPVSSDKSMSSFPEHSLFAPFILRSAYLSLSSSLSPMSYELPAMSYELPAMSYELPAMSYELPAMSYELPAMSYQLSPNHDTLESNPELINENVLKTALDLKGIKNYQIIPNNKLHSLESIINENRSGKSLWLIPLFIALALIPLEIYISKRPPPNK